jgi:tetratricopeptide (TPR) repeat protein
MRTDLWIHCKIILLAGLLSFLSAVFAQQAAAVSAAPGDFEELMKQVRGALTKLDLVSARALLTQVCQTNPSTWDPSVEVVTARTAVCETELGVIEEAARHPEIAERQYLRALEIWNHFAPEYSVYHAATLMNLGSVYRMQRRMTEAESMLTQAYALAGEHGQEDPHLLALVTSRLGAFYADSGASERGRRLLTEAIAMFRNLSTASPAELAFAFNAIGMLNVHTGDYKTAETNLREAVELVTDSLGEDHPDTAIYESSLGLALYLDGQYDRAELLLRRAKYVAEARLPGSLESGSILANLAAVETSLGQFAQAEADGALSLAILSAKRGPESLEVAFAKVSFATACLRERKLEEASKLLPEAIAVERRLAGDPRMGDQRVLAYAVRALGEVRAAQHQWVEAQALYSEAIGIYEAALGERHPTIAPVLREYADVLKHAGAPRAEVKRIEAKARAAIKT